MRRIHALYATEGGDAQALIARYGAAIDRQARRLVARIRNPDLFDDLWSAGAVGLLDASRRFDPSRDVRFESFAEHRIRGAMIDELRRLDHLPRRLRSDLDAIAAARESLGAELGREPDQEEIAAKVGMDLSELGDLEGLSQPPLPLAEDAPLAGDDLPADERLAKAQQHALVTAAVAALPDRLQLVMSLLYAEGLSNKEVAQVMGVSEARVSQLHSDSVKKLRAALVEQG